MRRHRLEFTASPLRAKMMGISFVKPCRKKARRLRTSAPCAVLTFVPCALPKMFGAMPPNRESSKQQPSNTVFRRRLLNLQRAAKCTPKFEAEGIEPTGMRRDGRASPTGREGREEFESMQEKRKEFLEKGSEVYAKT